MYSPAAPVGALTVASYVSVILPLAGINKPVQFAVLPEAVPALFTVPNVYPIGRISSTDTPVALLGPSLVITNSNSKVSPTFGVALPELNPLTILKSACAGAIVIASSSSSSPSPSPSSSTVSPVSGSLSGSY